MSLLSKYNKGSKFSYQAPKDSEFFKLKDLLERDGEGAIYPLKAMYINTKGNYGDHPVLITEHELVDCPSWLTSTVKDMLNDDELIKYINDGNVEFTIGQFDNSKGHGYNVRWIDKNEQ